MDHRLCLGIYLAFAMVILAPSALGTGGKQLAERAKARLLQQAPPEWNRYRVFTEKLQGTLVTRILWDGKLKWHKRTKHKFNDTCGLLGGEELSEPKQAVVTGYNSSYSFELYRGSSASWVLQKLEKPNVASKAAVSRPWTALVELESVELTELIR